MGYATILGLDLGKLKSVCCVMDADTGKAIKEAALRGGIRTPAPQAPQAPLDPKRDS